MVAPRTGAWIETESRYYDSNPQLVAPRTGAWIETRKETLKVLSRLVAPRTGAWIETRSLLLSAEQARMSPPARGRGLKLDRHAALVEGS